jgi:helix-turn-helix protein
MATQKDYILNFLKKDNLVSVIFSSLAEGEARKLKDGEEYIVVLKLKHVEYNWEKKNGGITG